MSKPINAEVKPKYKDESIDKLIKRFNRKVKKQRIIEQCLERKNYEKRSVKRRKEKLKRKKIMEKVHRKYNYYMDEQQKLNFKNIYTN